MVTNIKLIMNGHDFHYALESLSRVFFPDLKVEKIYNSQDLSDSCIYSSIKLNDCSAKIYVRFIFNGYDNYKETVLKIEEDEFEFKKECELRICSLLYDLLTDCTGYVPKWGMQTGVRPSKLYLNLIKKYSSEEKATEYMVRELRISSDKVRLVKDVCAAEEPIINSSEENQFSLYVSIPFCPSRCSYCSFISHSIDSAKYLIPEYVELVCKEIIKISQVTHNLALKLRSVYIGGGTPTILSAEQLKSIIATINDNFNMQTVTEFTVEAGRPDTLNEEKLKVLSVPPVTRITVNAQTFNDDILNKIGRKHTAEDIYKAYKTARKLGINNINTDLIAGLADESVESFLSSVKSAVSLNAENITIHTLALKRSSYLITRDNVQGKAEADTAQMIEKSAEILRSAGYIPYYMYRQSRSVGNLENTGWCKPKYECEYNIFMMEEIHTVFGVGAGAVTRLVDPKSGKIERVYNFKYPYEYINDFEQMIERKDKAAKMIKNYIKG